MAIAHDEAGPDAADAKVLAARQTRQIIQRQFHVRLRSRVLRVSLKPGSKASRIGGIAFHFNNAPAFAVAAIDREMRMIRILASVEDPVFLDRRHEEVQFDVANEILVGIVRGQDFHNQKWAHIFPTQLLQRQIFWKVSIGGHIRFRRRSVLAVGDEDSSLVVHEVDNLGMAAPRSGRVCGISNVRLHPWGRLVEGTRTVSHQ